MIYFWDSNSELDADDYCHDRPQLNCVCVWQRGRVPVLVFFFNPSANQSPGLLDGSTLAAVGNVVVVTASYRTDALGFLSTGACVCVCMCVRLCVCFLCVRACGHLTYSHTILCAGSSGLHGNYGLSDQEAVLRWVNAHISLVGGDNTRVTVGAERRGADITSLHLLSSSPPMFQRMMLMVRTRLLIIFPSVQLPVSSSCGSSLS